MMYKYEIRQPGDLTVMHKYEIRQPGDLTVMYTCPSQGRRDHNSRTIHIETPVDR